MVKSASEQLKERLIQLRSESTAKKTFTIEDIQSKAKKAKDTFNENDVHEHIQPQRAVKV